MKKNVIAIPYQGCSLLGQTGKEDSSVRAGVDMRKKYWSMVLFVLALTVTIFTEKAYSSAVPEEPILRIEMGMHSTFIPCIAVDAQNRFIVTGSWDKTVRLWELSTGRPVRTFRPPIGEGPTGMIFTVTFSPDGNMIVCGGKTKSEKEISYSVYLFDRESGKLLQKIEGLNRYITHLQYSKDGRFLVVGMAKNGGIRIYRTSDYFITGNDMEYEDEVYGVDFDLKGRLVTVSKDGFIRLYESDFKLIAKKKAPNGLRPARVCFSPDGSKITVSFFDPQMLNGKIDVLSGNDLSHQYSPVTRGFAKGFLGPVCWSLDGKFLYAGKGSWVPFIIRKWTEGGKGQYKDFATAEHYLTGLLPLKEGDIGFSSAYPSFGVFDANDKKILDMTPPITGGVKQNFLFPKMGIGSSFFMRDLASLTLDFQSLRDP